jgi:hypothetical protein
MKKIEYFIIAIFVLWIIFSAVLLHFSSKISIDSDISKFRTICAFSWLYSLIVIPFALYNIQSLFKNIQKYNLTKSQIGLCWLFIVIHFTNLVLCFTFSILSSKFDEESRQKVVTHLLKLAATSFAFSFVSIIEFVLVRMSKRGIDKSALRKYSVSNEVELPTIIAQPNTQSDSEWNGLLQPSDLKIQPTEPNTTNTNTTNTNTTNNIDLNENCKELDKLIEVTLNGSMENKLIQDQKNKINEIIDQVNTGDKSFLCGLNQDEYKKIINNTNRLIYRLNTNQTNNRRNLINKCLTETEAIKSKIQEDLQTNLIKNKNV